MNLKGVIFDYGGVLCFYPPDNEVQDFADATGLAKDTFLENYWKLRHPYERGDLTKQDYWADFTRRVGREYTPEQIDDFVQRDVNFWLHTDDRMLTWARELKKSGMRIAMLSNMPRELGEHMKVVFPWLVEFDHVTLSYEVRSAKPEAAIYWDAVNGLGLRPHEAVFLDDRSENIAGAEGIGLNAALFESAEAFSRSLRESGGLFGLRAGPVTVE